MGSAQRQRWVAVGRATSTDGLDAGHRAAANALAGPDPQLLLVFASEALDLPGVLAGIARSSPGTPVIGCSTAGEIASDGPSDASVVVTAFGGPGFQVATAVAREASGQLREAGAEAASCLTQLNGSAPHRVLLMLTDGLAGDQQEIVRGAYAVAGATVPLVGDVRETTCG